MNNNFINKLLTHYLLQLFTIVGISKEKFKQLHWWKGQQILTCSKMLLFIFSCQQNFKYIPILAIMTCSNICLKKKNEIIKHAQNFESIWGLARKFSDRSFTVQPAQIWKRIEIEPKLLLNMHRNRNACYAHISRPVRD